MSAGPRPLGGLGPASVLDVTPGRSLRWGPDWSCSDGRVLFDRHSGDYWVLAGDAVAVVQRLQAAGRSTLSSLQAGCADGSAALLHTLHALLHADVLRAWNDGVRVRPAAEVEDTV